MYCNVPCLKTYTGISEDNVRDWKIVHKEWTVADQWDSGDDVSTKGIDMQNTSKPEKVLYIL